ncbi:MAG: SBBP repeat-containing protein, partial [Thermoanaerobaculia bacterium]|nr:SBBP repeat-containing protein [Thermoanaerobaculia bacterium]
MSPSRPVPANPTRRLLPAAVLTVLALLAALPLAAQTIDWTARYAHEARTAARPGGGDPILGKRALATDAAGNTYVAGQVDAGTGSGTDFLTLKLDAGGALVWARTFAGTAGGHDSASALAVDGIGNVYVTGRSQGSTGGYNYATVKYDLAGALQWVREFNGSGNGTDYAHAVAVDASGNVYVAGQVSGATGGWNYATVKYDNTGALQWAREYNGSGNGHDFAHAVAVDGSGNVHVTGYAMGASGGNNYATLRYDSAGSLLWVREYQGFSFSDDMAYALALDGSGHVYVTGSAGAVSGGFNFATLKYDAAGALLWARQYNGSGNSTDRAYALALDAGGNVYVAGSAYGASGGYNCATVKYDGAGTLLWAEEYDGPGGNVDSAYALEVDAAGNAYVAGSSYGTTGSQDHVTLKYGSLGTLEWARELDGMGAGADVSYGVAIGASGSVVVSGYSRNASGFDEIRVASYDPAGLEQWASTHPATPVSDGLASNPTSARATAVGSDGAVYLTGSTRAGNSDDYLTVKLDPTGAVVWARTHNGSGNGFDSANALAIDGAGSVSVTGRSAGATGGDNYATLKYDAAGSLEWVREYDGTAAGADYAHALVVDGSGGVYVTGSSSGATGGANCVTVKYDSAGTLLWTREYNGTGGASDSAYAAAVDGDGSLVLAGSTFGATGMMNFLTLRYDSGGTLQWAREHDGTAGGDDFGSAIAVDGAGNVLVTGRSAGATGGHNFATVKYDSAGNLLWAREYNGSGNGHDFAHALAVDTAGNVFVTGYSDGASGGGNYATVKYDGAGNLEWAREYDGTASGADYPYALAVNASGDLYVAGLSWGVTGGVNFATVKYDSAGVEQWVALYDGPPGGTDQAWDLVLDSSSRVIVAGTSRGPDGTYDYLAIRYSEVPADTTPPADPTLGATAPLANVWSNDVTVDVTWSGAADEPGGSGLAGYSVLFDGNPATQPDTTVDVPHTTDPHATTSAPLADGTWYFHLSTCDVAGNCTATVHAGPFLIDATAPSAPGAVTSASHGDGLPKSDPTIDIAWAAATDNLSGVALYRYGFTGSSTQPSCLSLVDTVVTTSTVSAALTDGTWYAHLCAVDGAGNPGAVVTGGPYLVDTGAPTGLAVGSTSHTVSTWSNDSTIDFAFSGAVDPNGVAGYSVVFDRHSGTEPDATIDQAGTDFTGTASPDGDDWYLHVRACDSAGNCGTTVHLGPFWIDATAPSAPGAVTSASHGDGQPKSDPTIDVAWGAATDNLSSVALYRYGFTGSATQPSCSLLSDSTVATSASSGGLADGTWYAHVCAVDNAGNEGAVTTGGPYEIDLSAPEVSFLDSVASSGGSIGEAEVVNVAITQLLVIFDEAMNPTPAGSVSSYLVVSAGPDGVVDSANCSLGGDDTAVPVDSAGYAGTTATLGVNGGVALPDGLYRLFACASLTDLAGNALDGDGNGTGGDAFARTFRVDQTPPQVALVDSVADTGDGQVVENEATAVAITELLVTFDEPVQAASAQAVGNYLLAFGGSNGVVDSTNCVLGGDDVGVAVDSAAYALGTTTLGVNGGAALGEGRYRLFVCTGVVDLGGNALGGGTAFARSFTVDITAPGGVDPVTSASHGDGLPKADATIDVAWVAASDNLSSVALYRYAFTGSATQPSCSLLGDSTAATSASSGGLADGTWYAHVCAVDVAGNEGAVATGGPYVVDTAPPTGLAVLSTSHTVSTWSNDSTIDFSFSGATDPNGVAGYSVVFDQLPGTDPDTTVDQAGTTFTGTASPDGNDWYVHVRACDSAGNCGATVHLGPFWIDATAPSAPGAVTSASHGDGQPKSDATIDVAWGAATDNLSSVALYRYGFTGSATQPSCSLLGDSTAATSASSAALADGTWYAHVCAVDAAGNEGAVATGGPYVVDTAGPTGLAVLSTSHTVSAWSNDSTIDFGFSGATDPNGVAGYSVVFDQLPGTDPDTAVDQAGTSVTGTATPDGDDWYLHVRACDAAGNCGTTVHSGPYWIDTGDPSAPGAVTSSSHGGPPTNDPTIEVAWGAATDGLSGVAGYWVAFDANPTAACGAVQVTTGTTATSNPLGGGDWYAHVCAVDEAGNWGPVATGGPYAIDATPPRVTEVSTVRDTGDGTLGEGEVTGASVTQLYLTFDEAMGGPLADPASYRVTSAGPDLVLDTAGCGALDGDDEAVAIGGVAHDTALHRTVLRLATATSLPVGLYGAAACAALTDEAGNALDGNGDGSGGDDFVRLFGVEVTNLLANPNFDVDVAGWSGPALWGVADADGKPTSGSARIETAAGTGATLEIVQCVPVVPDASYRAGATARVESAISGAPVVSLRLDFHAAPACGGAPSTAVPRLLAAGTTSGA